jgi:hypothetical protein
MARLDGRPTRSPPNRQGARPQSFRSSSFFRDPLSFQFRSLNSELLSAPGLVLPPKTAFLHLTPAPILAIVHERTDVQQADSPRQKIVFQVNLSPCQSRQCPGYTKIGICQYNS